MLEFLILNDWMKNINTNCGTNKIHTSMSIQVQKQPLRQLSVHSEVEVEHYFKGMIYSETATNWNKVEANYKRTFFLWGQRIMFMTK